MSDVVADVLGERIATLDITHDALQFTNVHGAPLRRSNLGEV